MAKGRLVFTLPDVRYFKQNYNGKSKVNIQEGEATYDYEKDDIVIGRVANGATRFAELLTPIRNKLADLDSSGLIDNAKAFINNRKIYKMYFDNARRCVRLDNTLRFNPSFRYYSVRKMFEDENGAFEYISGVLNSGVLISNLVDLDVGFSESGDGSQVSTPAVAHTLIDMVDGETYIVEFYDSDRRLINIIPFQAIAVKASDYDLTPSAAIVDMYISSSRPYKTGDGTSEACYLYEGEAIDLISLRVYVKYADGNIKDITQEQSISSRLLIQWPDDIDVNQVTDELNDPKEINITYFAQKSNGIITSGATPSGAIVDSYTSSIEKKVPVFIRENVYGTVGKIVPVMYKNIAGNKLEFRIYAIYDIGVIRDVTDYATISNFSATNITTSQNINIAMNQNINGQASIKTFSNIIVAPISGLVYVSIRGEAIRLIQTAVGTTLFNSIDKATSAEAMTFNPELLSTLLADSASKYVIGSSGVQQIPNNIRIRDAMDQTKIFTDYVPALPTSYILPNAYSLNENKLFIVEFAKVTRNEQNQITSVFTTHAIPVYVDLA